MSDVVDERAGSILMADANYEPDTRWLMNYGTLGLNEKITRWLQRWNGGHWVAGRFTLYQDRLEFKPSPLSFELLIGIQELCVKLSSVDGVTQTPALLGGVIDIAHEGKILKMRCFGAEKFAQDIRKLSNQSALAGVI